MTRHTKETPDTADRRKGREWVKKLSKKDVGELGDAFVLGTFEWEEWLSKKPSAAFLQGAESERLYREQCDEWP